MHSRRISRSPSTCIPQSKRDAEEIRCSLRETWGELENVRKQIEIITEEIMRGNMSLRKLRETEEELLSIASAKASLLSPFQLLHRDIIDQIAGHFISMKTDITRMDKGIWPLTRINRFWRSNILSIPRLWSSFSIPNPEFAPLEVLSRVLELSKNHPLSFSIEAYPDDKSQSRRVSQVMMLISKHSERWKDVHLMGQIPPAGLRSIYNRLPLLERLNLGLTQPEIAGGWEGNPGNKIIFRESPRLCSLTILESTTFLTSVPFEFPNEQLHTVECVVTPGNDLDGRGLLYPLHLPFLNNLRSLHITCVSDCDDTWGIRSMEPVVLPVLQDLRLEAYTVILRILRLPSLKKLTLYNMKINASSGRLDDIKDYLDLNRDQKLTSFCIATVGQGDDRSIEKLLPYSAFRSLRELTLQPDMNDTMSWFKSLASRLVYNPRQAPDNTDRPSILLPHLRDFTFDRIISTKSKEGRDILAMMRAFIVPRTELIDETIQNHRPLGGPDHLPDEDAHIPARLENLYIKYSRKQQPITLTSIERLMTIDRDDTMVSKDKDQQRGEDWIISAM